MRVLLWHAGIGLYFAGHKHWVGHSAAALVFASVEQAIEASRDESFEEMAIVVNHDDPTCELVLPSRRKKPPDAEPLRPAA
jgi:hypothetical protein